MSDLAHTPRFRIARALQQIFSPYAVSNETLIASAIPIVLANLVLDFGREQGTFAIWLLIAISGYLAMLLIPVFVRIFLAHKAIPAIAFVAIFVAAGLVRGCVIFALGRELQVIPPAQWAYRIFGSTLFVFLSLSLIAVLVSNSLRATQELEALETNRRVLEKRLNSMRTEIARMNAEVAGRVSGLISPVIQKLMDNLKGAKAGEIGAEVQALRATVDDVIRPLSLDIAQNSDEISDTDVLRARVSLRQNFDLATKLQVANQFLPLWSSVLITAVSTPAAIVYYRERSLVALAIYAFTTIGSLELAAFLLRRLKLTVIWALLTQIVVFAIAGIVAGLALNAAQLHTGDYSSGRIVILACVIGMAVFVGQLRQTHRAATGEAAREVNAQLELLNSQARRELWLNRRRIATVLHGPVQAALYASAMRLAQASRPSKKLIQSVNADLETALEVLKFDSLDSPDLRSVLGQIVEVWAGSCEIYVSVPKGVYQITKKNALLSEAMVEVLREAISNAIKHGGATEIEVEAKLSAKFIDVSIVNNGKAPINKAGTGFGSKLYNELTHSWSLAETADGRTKFGATIFIA
jgi:signal transduction histidine kinase